MSSSAPAAFEHVCVFKTNGCELCMVCYHTVCCGGVCVLCVRGDRVFEFYIRPTAVVDGVLMSVWFLCPWLQLTVNGLGSMSQRPTKSGAENRHRRAREYLAEWPEAHGPFGRGTKPWIARGPKSKDEHGNKLLPEVRLACTGVCVCAHPVHSLTCFLVFLFCQAHELYGPQGGDGEPV